MNAVTSNMNGKAGCGCACGGQCDCEAGCCDLECLVRPNFFCGQMLTDADLAAMVEWTRGRLALARYRDGWGIACGLELSCAAPGGAASCCGDKAAANGPVVYVNAGYALDCCGNDLVVCEPLKVDLGAVCRPPDDPCDPRATATATPRIDTGAQAEATAADCLRLKAEDIFAVRLTLRYHEDVAQGQRAMFRGPCADDGPCQYARVLERPCVHLEEVALRTRQDDVSDEDLWRSAFRQRLAQLLTDIRGVLLKGTDALLQYIRHNPPYQFCFLEEMVCCLRKNETASQPAATQDLLHIAQLLLADWLLREVQCPCGSCLPDDGVPLGRVLMRRSVVAGRTQCSVVMIEQGAAYRRALRKDPCRPFGAGEMDLAQYMWQPADRAMAQLEMRGLKIRRLDAKAGDRKELERLVGTFNRAVLSADPAAGNAIGVYLAEDIAGPPRIAFFVQE